MPDSSKNKSEVARILEQISLEYEAAQRIMHDFAAGAANEQFHYRPLAIRANAAAILSAHDQLLYAASVIPSDIAE